LSAAEGFVAQLPADRPTPSLVRRVLQASWSDAERPDAGESDVGRLLGFSVEANAFCHQMVRSMVGMLVSVGRGQLRAGEVAAIVRSGDRALVPRPAPAHGLCLWAVRY
jgi:tRNA pseudouridine38-40 synthase